VEQIQLGILGRDPALKHHPARAGNGEQAPIDDAAWFAYLMGWRRHQVLSLRWSDINRDAGTVIRRAEFNKTKEPSVLAMSESVRAVGERRWHARAAGCDLVFHRAGQRIKDFRHAWERACIAAGLCETVKNADGTVSQRAMA
jgi:integrase